MGQSYSHRQSDEAKRILFAINETDRDGEIKGRGEKSLKMDELAAVVGADREEIRRLVADDLASLVERRGTIPQGGNGGQETFVLTEAGEEFVEKNRESLPKPYTPIWNGRRLDRLQSRLELLIEHMENDDRQSSTAGRDGHPDGRSED